MLLEMALRSATTCAKGIINMFAFIMTLEIILNTLIQVEEWLANSIATYR